MAVKTFWNQCWSHNADLLYLFINDCAEPCDQGSGCVKWEVAWPLTQGRWAGEQLLTGAERQTAFNHTIPKCLNFLDCGESDPEIKQMNGCFFSCRVEFSLDQNWAVTHNNLWTWYGPSWTINTEILKPLGVSQPEETNLISNLITN